MAGFTVDTHLFRELGELLVGRDSTALVELIKNAYDADATQVTVHGENLNDPESGQIVITDNGVGMTPDQFERGFLRIASRIKEEGDRRSGNFKRRYTGAKGVGRLAAHKLARLMAIYSIPDPDVAGAAAKTVTAGIDWDAIEALETLEDVAKSNALTVEAETRGEGEQSGTIMELNRLRRRWTEAERGRLFWEVQTFQPADVLVDPPKSAVDQELLFGRPRLADSAGNDPGFRVLLTGDLETGEEYWQTLLEAAYWVIEIDASRGDGQVHYRITPTCRCQRDNPSAEARTYVMPHPNLDAGPFFQARIMVREGSGNFGRSQRGWVGRNSGVRIYMEGFRVLPYGELSDDWLMINADVKRTSTFHYLEGVDLDLDSVEDKEAATLFLRNDAYFGAVFLTQVGAPTLRMLVNREGFIPDGAYDTLVRLVRIGIDLSVRHRAVTYRERRELRRERRTAKAAQHGVIPQSRMTMKRAVEESVAKASSLAAEAKEQADAWQFDKAQELIAAAAQEFSNASASTERLLTEPTQMRIVASVGLQMVSFVHEINSLLGMANTLDSSLTRIRKTGKFYPSSGTVLSRIHTNIGRLRHAVEKQASYLTDITSADGQRRRSRQKLSESFTSGVQLIEDSASRRKIQTLNDIPEGLRSPPMFRAEIALVFSNLLTNAVKAAGKEGRIRAWGEETGDVVTVRVENTGVAVDLADADKWFRPFQSTTAEVDPALGQGMGMGLPITRDMLEEYGAEIRFAAPSPEYATSVEIVFH